MVDVIGVGQDEALRERARREKARRHLIDFCQYVSPWYRAARHHVLAADYLEQVETYIRTRGENGIGRLLIFMPPRHGKTELVSKHFPAWVLGRLPDSRVILASYGADLAEGSSRAVRANVQSSQYGAVFGEKSTLDSAVELSTDSRSVKAWDLAIPGRGGVAAAGVGGGITGKVAHLLIVDDTCKNREEAESESNRERVWDWWTSSAYTRLEDGGAVVGMLTRWHQDDWAGRLIKQMASETKADRYVVVCLPALAEAELKEGWEQVQRERMMEGVWIERKDELLRKPGEALWREKFSEQDLERIRANIGIYDFEALYQQQPYLRSGSYFMRDWLPVVEQGARAEEIKARVRYWDKASSKSGDYTAGVLMSRMEDGKYYVEHVTRGRWTMHERERVMIETGTMDKNRPGAAVQTWHQQDPGSAGLDSAKATNASLAASGIEAHFETVTGSKEDRAGPYSGMCQAGNVYLMRGGWNHDFVEEHVAFPKGKYDDQVDAAASAFNKLSEVGPVVLFEI